MTKTARLLRELVALPSVNPAFLPPGDPRTGEHRVADCLAAMASQAGMDVEFQKISSERANLLVTLSPSGKVQRRILLAPHLDTVPSANPEQMVPRLKQGRLYGRGACDTKGSVAAMFLAMQAMATARRRPKHTEIVFAGLVDEESGQAGSRALAASGIKADLAIVGEPTLLEVVTAHKGDIWLRIQTHGKAAHGACPDQGRNAVHAMARVVDALETEYAAQLRQRTHPLLGHATVNVGRIVGGTQPNIVPDLCEIAIDRRTLPGETDAGVRREIQTLLRGRGLKVTLSNRKTGTCLPLETNPRLALVQELLRAAGRSQSRGVHYFCDASVLALGGIPSVVFGPGNIAQAHTSDEWISLVELDKAARILTRFLQVMP
ncbi:MAG: M20 family metallopeptidase [Verrucomicrobiota bacterium]